MTIDTIKSNKPNKPKKPKKSNESNKIKVPPGTLINGKIMGDHGRLLDPNGDKAIKLKLKLELMMI